MLNYGTRTLPPELVGHTAVLFLPAAVFLLLGASCYLGITGIRRATLGSATITTLPLSATSGTILLLAALVPTVRSVIWSVARTGVQTLLHRPSYIEGRTDIGPIFSLGEALALAAVTISGYIWSTARSWITRIGSVSVTVLYAAIFFSLASRSIALVPLAFSSACTRPSRRREDPGSPLLSRWVSVFPSGTPAGVEKLERSRSVSLPADTCW